MTLQEEVMAKGMENYSTLMPDGRLLRVQVVKERTSPDVETSRTVYSIGEEEVTKAQAQKAYDAQPAHWQRGRTFQQMLDFWFGRQTVTR